MAKRPKADEFAREAEAPETKPKGAPEPDEDGQYTLIDTEHPAEKQILKLAKQIKAKDQARGAIQDEADKLRGKLKDLMHENKIKFFQRGKVKIEIVPADERVSVKGVEDADDEE